MCSTSKWEFSIKLVLIFIESDTSHKANNVLFNELEKSFVSLRRTSVVIFRSNEWIECEGNLFRFVFLTGISGGLGRAEFCNGTWLESLLSLRESTWAQRTCPLSSRTLYIRWDVMKADRFFITPESTFGPTSCILFAEDDNVLVRSCLKQFFSLILLYFLLNEVHQFLKGTISASYNGPNMRLINNSYRIVARI